MTYFVMFFFISGKYRASVSIKPGQLPKQLFTVHPWAIIWPYKRTASQTDHKLITNWSQTSKKGKAVRVQAWASPEGSRRLRLADFLVSRYSIRGWAQGHSAAGRIMSKKNSNNTIRNRIRDLPAYGAVPQPTAPFRAPIINQFLLQFLPIVAR